MNMEEKIKALQEEIAAYAATDKEGVEAFRLKYISKKGVVGELFEALKQVPVEEKKIVGKILNELKKLAEAKLVALNESTDTGSSRFLNAWALMWRKGQRWRMIGIISQRSISRRITRPGKCRTRSLFRKKMNT